MFLSFHGMHTKTSSNKPRKCSLASTVSNKTTLVKNKPKMVGLARQRRVSSPHKMFIGSLCKKRTNRGANNQKKFIEAAKSVANPTESKKLNKQKWCQFHSLFKYPIFKCSLLQRFRKKQKIWMSRLAFILQFYFLLRVCWIF